MKNDRSTLLTCLKIIVGKVTPWSVENVSFSCECTEESGTDFNCGGLIIFPVDKVRELVFGPANEGNSPIVAGDFVDGLDCEAYGDGVD